MADQLYTMSCEPCGFVCMSSNQKELAEMGNIHIKQNHPEMRTTADDISDQVIAVSEDLQERAQGLMDEVQRAAKSAAGQARSAADKLKKKMT